MVRKTNSVSTQTIGITFKNERIIQYILHVGPFPVRNKIDRFEFVYSYGRSQIVLYKSKVDTINMTERLEYK